MLLTLLLASFGARAAESNRVVTARDTVSLVSHSDRAGGKTIPLGLLFRLAPGWHIYWKNPGDAGEPPSVTLRAPAGAKAGAFAWPAPQWLVAGSVGDYVETGTVLLPFNAVLPAPAGRGVQIAASAHWLVCSATICVPEQGVFRLRPDGAAPAAEARLFAKAAAELPRPSPYVARVTPGAVLTVTGPDLGTASVKSAHFFPDSPADLVNAAPEKLSFIKDGFALDLRPAGWKPGAMLHGVLEITGPSGTMRAVTIVAPPGPAVPATAPRQAPLIIFLAGAFLGGVILNLMPCVFPVLAIKAMSVARLGIANRRAARMQALAYAAGAITAMLLIGIALLMLRASGRSFGWGFEFQSPVFVTVMAWLVFVVGLSFAGFFEISAGRFGNIGTGIAARGDLLGSFATGLLAVAVATPCTAPFMGAALAAALAAPAPAALGVFAALGLGVALPFLVIGFIPGFGRLLPSPGAWMLVLRQLLAFPMFATAVWLLWVMTQEAGPAGALILAGGAVLLAFALWLLRFRGILPRVLAVAAAVLVLSLLPRIVPSQAAGTSLVAGSVPFSEAKLAALRAAGTPVLVDMSAAWCITCLANEDVALEPAAMRRDFTARHITLMVGDWTNRNPGITRYLAAHGRDGVPLYVYYPPDHRRPVILPQILTPGIVRRTIGG
jgi:DsbC/DsbD-like thiol-disulfide interchange protein/cytochrome c biogenesis protein CcdA